MSSSSMNPRKFSEKIEIHKKKISEETAAFEKIMAEVQMVKHDGNARTQQSHQQTGLLPPMYYPRSGSLPNVHMSTTNPNLAEMHQNYIQPGSSMMDDRSPAHPGAIHPSRNANRSPGGHYHPYPRNSSPNFRHISPVRGPTEVQMAVMNNGGMYFQQHPSPASYLLPVPAESPWRRVSSDPGIHASILQTSPQQLNGGGQSCHSTPTPSPPMNRSPPALTASQGHLDQQQQLMRSQSRPLPHSQENYADMNEGQAGRIPVANSPGSLSDCSPTSNSYSIPGSDTITDDGQCYAGSYQGNTADIQQGHNVPYSIGVECGQQGSAYPPSYIQLISPPQRSAQSAPGSPSSASPTVSMQQQVSYPPGFSSIAAQMQNISIDHRNIQQQQQNMVGNTGQIGNVQSNYYAGQTSRGDGNVQQGMMDSTTYNYLIQQQQQQYSNVPEMMQTPSPGSVNSHQDVNRRRSYQPMSPDSSQIPNIVLTNFDGAVVRSPYDHSLDCEDLKEQMALGDLSPADLSALQYESGRDFSIDAATEDALRHDRL